MKIGSHQFYFVKKDLISLNEVVTRIELKIIDDKSLNEDSEDDQIL